MNKSVLFIINGFGMGNATRCDSLMDILANQYNIDVITSDKAYDYYKSNSKIANLYKQIDLNLQQRIKFGSFKYYLKYVPHFFSRLVRNFRIQKNIQAQKKYEAIFYDSDYGFILNALSIRNKNIVGVNNSYEVLSYLAKNPKTIKLSLIPSLFVELVDFLTHYLFCNYVVCPCLGYNFNEENTSAFKKVLLCAPLIRKCLIDKHQKHNQTSHDHVLVMSSSSNVESGISLLNQGPLSGYTFLTDGLQKDNTDNLISASLVICNSGQSSLTECLYLNKKALIEALPSHSEQYVNSLIAENRGLKILNSNETYAQINALKAESQTDYKYNYDLAVVNIRAQLLFIEKDKNEYMR
ncbi:hypothetical protein K2P97_06380 [bacterium]|nr:hypothetical protein [bacterium]